MDNTTQHNTTQHTRGVSEVLSRTWIAQPLSMFATFTSLLEGTRILLAATAILICLQTQNLVGQNVPGAQLAECAGTGTPLNGQKSTHCDHSSQYWGDEGFGDSHPSDIAHLPHPDAGTIRFRVNFIICQRSDGSGNFQNNAQDIQFLNDWVDRCNAVLTLWDENQGSCSQAVANHAKFQVIPNFVFIQDDFAWNNDNDPGPTSGPNYQIPNEPGWWLNNLDASIHTNSSIPKGLNVYLTVDGSTFNAFQSGILEINNKTGNCAQQPNWIECHFRYWWSGEFASLTELNRSVRAHCPNFYLKYLWFQQRNQTQFPFSTTRGWLINEGQTLAHEFGHNFGMWHSDACQNLMSTNNQSSKLRNWQVGRIHRYLATSAMRQFVDCDDTYNNDGASHHTERVVSNNETWDLDMRVFSDVRVRSGATLTISCKLLMPENGVIHVERGAKLLLDEGEIWRANTCNPNQYWSRIGLHGNFSVAQPGGNSPIANAGGIVELHKALIEGARVGISTYRAGEPWTQDFWGGKVISNESVFQDCRKGVEFMKYDLPNLSSFKKTKFIKTGTGTTHVGVSIWDTDGISFNETTFKEMQRFGIISGDAVISMQNKCEVSNSLIGVHMNYTNPVISGISQIGSIQIQPAQRNKFTDNTVGLEIFAGGRTDILNNSFKDYDFDMSVAGNATTYSELNDFGATSTGCQFDETGDYANTINCNNYSTVLVGTNVQGKNRVLKFDHETYQTNNHDVFIENNATSLGQMATLQGLPNAALQNSFTVGQGANIQHSTAAPWDPSQQFYYFYDSGNPIYRPDCAQNDPNCGNPSGLWDIFDGGERPAYKCVKPMVECQEESCWHDVKDQYTDTKQMLDYGKSAVVLNAAAGYGVDALQLLAGASPYLSDEVLQAIIENQAFSPTEILDLLVANAPLVGSIYELAQRNLSSSLLKPLTDIQLSQNISIRAGLEHQLLELASQENELASKLLSTYIATQNFGAAIQMLSSDLDNLNRKRLFGVYLHQGNYDAASDILATLPAVEVPDSDFKTVQAINIRRLRNHGHLDLDATDIAELEAVIAHDGAERFIAQSLIVQLTEAAYLPDMPNLEGSKRKATNREESKASIAINRDIKLNPNPATDEVYFALNDSKSQIHHVTLTAMHSGKKVVTLHQRDLATNKLNVSQLPTGVYTVQFVFSDGQVTNVKLVVQR
jgi:Secretion system C-terminal sorting domain